jgi:hypothetical protein
VTSFIGGRNREYPEKTTDLPQVTDKTLSHNVVLNTPKTDKQIKYMLIYNTLLCHTYKVHYNVYSHNIVQFIQTVHSIEGPSWS